MSRWIGHDHINAVLKASDTWREKCVLSDGSIFSRQALWTPGNIHELKRRFLEHPIEGSDRDFFDKLKEQLDGAPNEVIRLASEMIWFLLLFPIASATKPDTKRSQIKDIWSWSGTHLPKTVFLEDHALKGVGHPGTAYLTRRHEQFGFFLEAMDRWKKLSKEKQEELMAVDVPWKFVEWLDEIDGADRRPVRNAILYFLFPDNLERNISNEHRRKIVDALKYRLPEELRPKERNPSLYKLDHAISELRKVYETELKRKELDFYQPPIYEQWSTEIQKKARTEIGSELKKVLNEYGLELRQCGSKKENLEKCNKPLDEKTGFWRNPTDATNKPLRWFLHFELVDDHVIARVPKEHGAQRIAFANTAQGTSGAVITRIIPVMKINKDKFIFYEIWEWLLLHCFLPALPAGSSGQLFEKFDEKTGKLTYMGEERDYIMSSLITLQDNDSEFFTSGMPRAIKYAEATQAISTLIHISPVHTALPEQGSTGG